MSEAPRHHEDGDGAALIWVRYLARGRVASIRPMQSRDAETLQAYVRGLTRECRRNRFLGALNELSPQELARLTDGRRPGRKTLMVEIHAQGRRQMIGEAPYAIAVDTVTCEFAISVTDLWQRRGIGTLMLSILEAEAAKRGVRHLVADAFADNEAVKAFAEKNGFAIGFNRDDARLVQLRKRIDRQQIAPDAPSGRRLIQRVLHS